MLLAQLGMLLAPLGRGSGSTLHDLLSVHVDRSQHIITNFLQLHVSFLELLDFQLLVSHHALKVGEVHAHLFFRFFE